MSEGIAAKWEEHAWRDKLFDEMTAPFHGSCWLAGDAEASGESQVAAALNLHR